MKHLLGSCIGNGLIPHQAREAFKSKAEKYNYVGLVFDCFTPNTCQQAVQSNEEQSSLDLRLYQFIANYFFFLISVDDRIDASTEYDKRNHLLDDFINVMHQLQFSISDVEDKSDPHVRFMVQLMKELHGLTSNQSVINRFIKHMEDFYNIGIRNSEQSTKETPEQYLERRLFDSATYAMLPIVELTSTENAIGLSIEEYESQKLLFATVERSCNIVLSLVNDLLSYHKDVLLPSLTSSTIDLPNLSYLQVLLKNNSGMSLMEATTICLEEIQKHQHAVNNQVETNQHLLNKKQVQYLRGIKEFMDGMSTWMCFSNRYRNKDSPFEELCHEI